VGRVSDVSDCYSEHARDLTEASFDQMVGRVGSAPKPDLEAASLMSQLGSDEIWSQTTLLAVKLDG